ncbi:LAFE_0H11782g1_1 [Lachancea fermentati]|uniref:LAFE_0H11782g1_1 n=1 Tax=Lachancea fermentati TaxID=4955 RepID=A0A1G4MKD2_LACFM|nr:LAFE_0H11782g1_1 [Lachancea fermentati]
MKSSMRWTTKLALVWLLQLVTAQWKPEVTKQKSGMSYMLQPFDDSPVILREENSKLSRSSDSGKTWEPIDSIKGNTSYFEVDRNYPSKRAFVYTRSSGMIYVTDDQAETWSEISLPWGDDLPDENEGFSFCDVKTHPQFEGDVIVSCNVCRNKSHSCEQKVFLSKNGKEFNDLDLPKPEKSSKNDYSFVDCEFFREYKESQLGGDHEVVCISRTMVNRHGSMFFEASSIVTTNDYGKTTSTVHNFEGMTPTDLRIVGDYCVITTIEDKFNSESVRRLWVSRDGKNFDEAYFPSQLRSDLVIQSLGGSKEKVVASVSSPDKGDFGGVDLLLSDSTGLKFTPMSSLLSDDVGYYFLQSVDELEGTVLSTFNAFVSAGPFSKAVLKSRISFDDGQSWSYLKVDDPNNEYSCDVSDPETCSVRTFWFNFASSSQIVGSPTTAGILALTGVVGGEYDYTWDNQQTFISRDGGATWRKILDFSATVAFGDLGNIIVAAPYDSNSDGDPASEFYYSLDQGETWSEYEFDEEMYIHEVTPTSLDGSGLTFIISGTQVNDNVNWEDREGFIYTIDFSSAFESKKCSNDEMEDWYLNDGKCLKGAKRKFRRRKQDAKCLVRELYENAKIIEETCPCDEEDYECAPEFVPDGSGNCLLDHTLLSRSGACSTRKSHVKLAPKQLERGNLCNKPLKINEVDVSCTGNNDKGATGDVSVVENELDFKMTFYQYFDTIGDETVIALSDKHDVYLSHDNGQNFRQLRIDDTIIEVMFNPYFNSSAYLFGKSGKLYITNDRARSFSSVELPDARQLGFPLSFHAKDSETFIFYGGQGCKSLYDDACHAVAFITRDGGSNFEELAQGAYSCEFVGSTYEHPSDDNMIMCAIKDKETNKRSLVTSNDFFKNNRKVVFDEIVGYVSTGEYTIIAVPRGSDELRAYVTIDGEEFAEAVFPADLSIKQQAYTVLGSQQGAIFFHLTTESSRDKEFGALMKSNSNGTSFVVLERAVNRGPRGYVDFEKLQGLEGIVLVNVVSNAEGIKDGSEDSKRLKSKITFNEGADWQYIYPPSKNSEGKNYACKSKSLEDCSLNLHGFTERKDIRDTYSSGSALGYMIGVGNVGEYLLPYEDCSTFMSTDGGITWKEVKNSPYQWEYGDHGSIIVLVPDSKKTDAVTYSTDSGKTWKDFKFTEEEVFVDDIVTVPQDSAMRFMMVATSPNVKGQKTKTFTLDFSGCFNRQCVLDFENERNDDYDYAPIANPGSECLFGHQAEYLKKINDDCYNGAAPLKEMVRIVKNCSCTRNDFECDYNFYKAKDGTCKLVEGLDPSEPSDICKKTDAIEYFNPTGYRKVPMSTCVKGLELDKATVPKACPGKEKQFNEKYKVNRISLVFIIGVPLFIFVFATWFVYDRGIRRNGGFARFGEIRLGDDELIEENQTDRAVNSIVKFGVFAFTGMSAVAQFFNRQRKRAVEGLRSIFSRNRNGPSYSSLTHDQFLDEADELLNGHDEDASDLASFMNDDTSFDVDTEEDSGTPAHEPYSDHVDEAHDSAPEN